MGLVRTGEPDGDGAGTELGLLGDAEPEHVAEQVGHLVDVRAVQQGVVEARDAHPTRFGLPDVGIDRLRGEVRRLDLGIELDAMAARDHERDAPPEAGLLAGVDVGHLHSVGDEVRGELLQRGGVQDLEGHVVHAGGVRFAQRDAVMVELVPPLEEDPPVVAGHDFVESEPVAVVDDGVIHVEDADLDESGAKYAVECHGCCSLYGTR